MTEDTDLRALYQAVILDHSRTPRNFRHPEAANRQARGDNPVCGDRVTVYLTLSAEDRIEDAAFEGRGCAISTASASLMTEAVRGRGRAEAERLFNRFHGLCLGEDGAEAPHPDDIESLERLRVLSGVRAYPTRVKCATLPWHALKAALAGAGTATTEPES
jgi:nitrogen fixation NifU-like protein